MMDLFEDNKEEQQKDYPTEAILEFMALILHNNIFYFIYTCWTQKKGMEIGTFLVLFYVSIVMGHRD